MEILIADDQPKVRSALQLLMEQEMGWKVVVEVAEAAELISQVEGNCPDLVLLDWELPGLQNNGNGCLSTLRALCPNTSIIALSCHPAAREAALAAGVDAFVSKCAPPERLVAAVTTVSSNYVLKKLA